MCVRIHLASSPPDRTMLLQPGASNEVRYMMMI